MRYWCWFLLLFSLSGWSHPLIKVGGYPYAPFVVKISDSHYEGLTLDLIDQLNEIQQEVKFIFVPTSAANRYKALDLGRFSLMLFEDSKWGWQTDKLKMTAPFLGGGEVGAERLELGRDDVGQLRRIRDVDLVQGDDELRQLRQEVLQQFFVWLILIL